MSDEGDDRLPKRKIKRVMVLSSASGSDSDESVGVVQGRKKRLRVVSDEEASDSSGSSVVRGSRRGKARVLAEQSDSGDSDAAPPPATAEGFASDSSEGNSDKCSICLLRFRDQEVGTPQSCEHIFCLDCITEWSKNVNTCPVDRLTFDSIVVRSCVGGRVLRTEPVVVAARRASTTSSIDILELADPTVCEICGGSSDEETMLLCDGCDLGFHMHCLSPPLTEVPIDQWFCENCDDGTISNLRDIDDVIYLSEVDDLLSLVDFDLPLGPRRVPLRVPRNTRRSQRNQQASSGPSTSQDNVETASTSRGSRANSNRATTQRRRTTTQRRPRRRNRTKTVIIEYEVQENGKFPITKRVKRKLKKRKSGRRQPRTAARRSLVRAAVRERLAASAGLPRPAALPAAAPLSALRQSAGIPALSLFGDSSQLDDFSDEDAAAGEGGVAAVAPVRRSAAIVSAFRQARRKMISIPSPPHASSAPDLLSNILDSQTLLHSKKSVVSVTAEGQVNIKLQKTEPRINKKEDNVLNSNKDKLDLSKGEDKTKKAPSYPGQSGGGRGWGGGYQGSYPRDSAPQRPPNYDNNYSNNNYNNHNNHPGNNYPQNNNMRRDEFESYGNIQRRPQYSPYDDQYDRNRRPNPDGNQNRNFPNNRHSLPPWPPSERHEAPLAPHRASTAFETPVDMRMGQVPPQTTNNILDTYRRPLPEPPAFKFDKMPDFEKSEDEKSDPGLVIDTEKYDPTEPTVDEDSGDDGKPKPPEEVPMPPEAPPAVQSILAGIDTSALNVPPNVLDSAVRQVLEEHRNLMAPAAAADGSDDESDGDCPNFSIYSATSVHIANTASMPAEPSVPQAAQHEDNLEDLVQEDDDVPTEPLYNKREKTPEKVHQPNSITPNKLNASNIINKVDEEYKERVSKRCPITVTTRNPIKIKLNTPSLIKRVSLYDEEDVAVEPEPEPEPPQMEPTPVVEEEKSEPLRSPQTPLLDDNDYVTPQEPSATDDANEVQTAKLDTSLSDTKSPPRQPEDNKSDEEGDDDDKDLDKYKLDVADTEKGSDEEKGEISDSEVETNLRRQEKMTESISETEDERSYTPCLDEHRDVDDPGDDLRDQDIDKDKGLIEGLDTEMISEDDANDIFSDEELRTSPVPTQALAPDKRKDKPEEKESKKKKKKESKKEAKEKKNKTKKTDVTFKKLSKSGKERNYRERDKDDKEKRRRDSSDERRRKKKRKDLERYDVRSVVGDKRKGKKDSFGRDVSPPSPPRRRSASKAGSPRARSPHSRPRGSSPRGRRSASRTRGSPVRIRRSVSRPRGSPVRLRRSVSRTRGSPVRLRRSVSRPRGSPLRLRRSVSRPRGSPLRAKRSLSRVKRSLSRAKRSVSRARRSSSRVKRSISRTRRSISRPKRLKSRSLSRPRRSASPVAPPPRRRRSSPSPPAPRRRRSPARKRRRSVEPKKVKKKKSPRRKSPKRKKVKRRSVSRSPSPWSPPSLASPRTPPPPPRRHKRAPPPPSKEVFTSGDNILVSVSFAEQTAAPPPRRKRRRRAPPPAAPPSAAKPVAIIDLERSPFRELTPSPKNVIVLSDSEHGEEAGAAEEPVERGAVGPKTPPEPAQGEEGEGAAEGGPAGGPAPRAAEPDVYDPFEPTRSPSPSPSPSPPPAADEAPPSPSSPPRVSMTLEAAQKTNMSADEVIDRRPISPIEKVMALLQSTRDVSPEPPPSVEGAATGGERGGPAPGPPPAPLAPRVLLPEPSRPLPPKLFLAKPSPIKSNLVKPMQATKISKLPLPAVRREAGSEAGGDSPYSPGSSDFADLFEPLPSSKRDNMFDSLFGPKTNKRKDKNSKPKPNKRKGHKTQVGVRMDEDSLKVVEELPSSAVEMQVKSKVRAPSHYSQNNMPTFLKKLNRQERVVEEVKLVLKPHYNKKHVTKEEYKDILRKTVPKICHNKTGEINPTKIQSLVEAYVKKFRKKHKLGIA